MSSTDVNPLSALPTGTFPLSFSKAMSAQLNPPSSSLIKRKSSAEEVYAFRYAFKPGSIGHQTPGAYEARPNGSQMVFDSGPAGQVFDVREEASKPRECVLIFDQASKSFTLHPVPATLHLTLNRNASRRPASLASSTSSSSVPLSRRPPARGSAREDATNADADADADSFSSGDMRHEVSSMIGVEETPRPKTKRLRTDDSLPSGSPTNAATAQGRVTKGGKGLPRKRPPMETAPIPVLTSAPAQRGKVKPAKGKPAAGVKGKSTAPKGKGKKGVASAGSQTTPSKIKSAEFIEDSDEEVAKAEASGGVGDEDDDDMFARMVGESLAQDDYTAGAGGGGGYGDEDDEDDEEGESEDDEGLGGARLIVGQSGVGDDDSEWI